LPIINNIDSIIIVANIAPSATNMKSFPSGWNFMLLAGVDVGSVVVVSCNFSHLQSSVHLQWPGPHDAVAMSHSSPVSIISFPHIGVVGKVGDFSVVVVGSIDVIEEVVVVEVDVVVDIIIGIVGSVDDEFALMLDVMFVSIFAIKVTFEELCILTSEIVPVASVALSTVVMFVGCAVAPIARRIIKNTAVVFILFF
jgi:hypothetical protein